MRADPDDRDRGPSRREFLAAAPAAVLGLTAAPGLAAGDGDLTVTSPDSRVAFKLVRQDKSRLAYQVRFRKEPVVEPSPLGITVDGADLGRDAEVGSVESYRLDEKY